MECAMAHIMSAISKAPSSAPPITQAVTTPALIRFVDHAGFDPVQHRSHARHRIAYRGFERRSPRLEVGECPGGRAAGVLAQVRFGALEIFRGRLPQRVGDAGDFRRRVQCPGEFELRAQRIQQILLARTRRSARGLRLRGDARVNGQRAIERSLHGGDMRQVRAGLGLQLHGAQRAKQNAALAQQQDAEHYVEAPGDRNRSEPPARVSTCHYPSRPSGELSPLRYRRIRGGP